MFLDPRFRAATSTCYKRQTVKFEDFYTDCACMKESLRLSQDAADSPWNVLICGATGTGKNFIAQAIHNQSARREGPYIHINCANHKGRIESDLFGFQKGAYTGADKGRDGLLIEADGGTAFLDEFHAYENFDQMKLLTVIEEGRLPIWNGKPKQIDVRFILATSVPMETLMAGNGPIRLDVLSRVCFHVIQLPTLAQRREDIPFHFAFYLRRAALRYQREAPVFGDEVKGYLKEQGWPTNLRGLKCLAYNLVSGKCGATLGLEEVAAAYQRLPAPRDMEDGEETGPATLNESTLCRTLERAKGNKRQAARLLGVDHKTIYRHFAKLPPEKQAELREKYGWKGEDAE